MRKLWLATLLFLCIYSCKESPQPRTMHEVAARKKDSIAKYPHLIDSLELESLYDKTKWVMYCIHCDDTLKFWTETHINEKVTFGSLPLLFDTLMIRNDTVELNFLFSYNGQSLGSKKLIKNSVLYGAVYKKYSDSIICYSKISTARYIKTTCFDYNNCPSRLVKPLQPEVIKYINDNVGNLHPWFRKEAKRRGIIQYNNIEREDGN